MATQYLGAGTFLANTTITTNLGVVISNNGGVGLSTTGSCDGFALVDGVSGDYISVAFLTNNGTLKGTLAAAPVTAGDTVYLGSSGLISTTGTITIGKSKVNSSTTGSVIEFIPKNV